MDKRSNIHLNTLTREEKEKIMLAYKKGRDLADSYYKAKVEPSLVRRYDVYRADKDLYKKKFPNLSEFSSWVSRDVKVSIDWIMPSLMEAFTGTSDPVNILGVQVSDDDNARKIQELISYFLTRKNNYFQFLYTFLRDGMELNFGCAKVYWMRNVERETMEVLATPQVMQELLQGVEQGQIEIRMIVPITAQGDLVKVVFDILHVKDNQPVLENMSPSELRFTNDARELSQAKFVAHRKIVTGDYLKRQEQKGVYQDVDVAMEQGGKGFERHGLLEIRHNEERNTIYSKLSDGDTASREYELYEAYLKVDYNGDGIYENLIVHAVGDVPVSIQENPYDRPPFFVFSPEHDPYAVFADESIGDVIEQLQDLKTALIRQMIIAVAKNNIPQKFVDENNVDMDALYEGAEIVPVKNGTPPAGSIFLPPPIQLDGTAMSLVQYAQNEIESQTGSTRYNQGLDSSSLNHTAVGITAIMGASDKKIKLLARMAAETAWIPIVKFIILLCQKFVDDGQIIRLADQNVTIRQHEINIDYDLIVNIGQGAGTKEVQINYLMVLIGQLYPKLEQIGVVNASSWYNITKELLEAMGIRSVEKYLIDPHSEEFQAMQEEAKEAQAMQAQKEEAYMQKQMELQEQSVKAQTLARLSARFKDLPIDAQIQALESLGLQTSPESMQAKIVRDMMMADKTKYRQDRG